MEITGKLIQLLPEVSGESARGPWIRGGFVIETDGDYPRKVAFTAFGEERVAMAKSLPMGSLVLPPATTGPVPLPQQQLLPPPPQLPHSPPSSRRTSPPLPRWLRTPTTTCPSKI